MFLRKIFLLCLSSIFLIVFLKISLNVSFKKDNELQFLPHDSQMDEKELSKR